MAAPTPEAIRLRVEAILETVPEVATVITDDACTLTDGDLPAVLVMVRRAERRQTNQNWWYVDRIVQIGALFTRLCGDSVEEQRAQLLAAEALLEVIPDTFNRLDRLYLAGSTPTRLSIERIPPMNDGGLETRAWGEEVYYSATYEMTITMQRS